MSGGGTERPWGVPPAPPPSPGWQQPGPPPPPAGWHGAPPAVPGPPPPPNGHGAPPHGWQPAAPGPYTPGGYGPPGRKGVPGWLWLLIGGAVVLGVAVTVLVFALAGAGSRDDADCAPGGAACQDEPAQPEEPSEEQPAAENDYPLTEPTPFVGQVTWGWPLLDEEWRYEVRDSDGYNAVRSVENGCLVVSYQGVGVAADPNAANDDEATAADFAFLFDHELGSYGVDGASAKGTAPVTVFAGGTAEYRAYEATIALADQPHELYERWLVRSFLDAGATTYVRVSCTSPALTDEVSNALLPELTIVALG